MRTNTLRVFGFTIAITVGFLSFPAAADKQVIFRNPTDSPAFEKAMESIGAYLAPEDYLDRAKRDRIAGDREPDPTEALAYYVRKYVLFGTGDIDDDGIDERFYILDEPFIWCGSKGCKILITQDHNGSQKLICATSGVPKHVWITDWMSEGSERREIEAVFRVYWRDGRCHHDDPEIQGEYKLPPPPARRWKPMR